MICYFVSLRSWNTEFLCKTSSLSLYGINWFLNIIFLPCKRVYFISWVYESSTSLCKFLSFDSLDRTYTLHCCLQLFFALKSENSCCLHPSVLTSTDSGFEIFSSFYLFQSLYTLFCVGLFSVSAFKHICELKIKWLQRDQLEAVTSCKDSSISAKRAVSGACESAAKMHCWNEDCCGLETYCFSCRGYKKSQLEILWEGFIVWSIS